MLRVVMKIGRRVISLLRPRWNLGVFGLIFNLEGKLLLVKVKGYQEWWLPGGEVEVKEQEKRWWKTARQAVGKIVIPTLVLEKMWVRRTILFEYCLRRELKEELGIEIHSCNSQHPVGIYPWWGGFPQIRDLALTFLIEIEGEPFPASLEVVDCQFFSREEVKELPLKPRMEAMILDGFEACE